MFALFEFPIPHFLSFIFLHDVAAAAAACASSFFRHRLTFHSHFVWLTLISSQLSKMVFSRFFSLLISCDYARTVVSCCLCTGVALFVDFFLAEIFRVWQKKNNDWTYFLFFYFAFYSVFFVTFTALYFSLLFWVKRIFATY